MRKAGMAKHSITSWQSLRVKKTLNWHVNEKTSEIAAQVGRTPQNWNSSVFSMIQNLSESVVVPIDGIIITLVLCYELISMLTERNNLHDVDTWIHR